MKIKIIKTHPDAIVPKIASLGAACCDLVATEITYTNHNRSEVLVKLGIATEIPAGFKACIAPRSSFTSDYWVLQNSPAQIDSDYRGEWMLKFKAIPTNILQLPKEYGKRVDSVSMRLLSTAFPYKVGDRVAQMWLEKVIQFEFELASELTDTQRGDGGFGSTGLT